MLKLTDRGWKEFFIGGSKGVFNVRASNSGIDKNKLLPSTENNIPYITRSNINNGISDFIGEKQLKKFNVDNLNVITIGLDTQTVFYQSHSFYTGQNIQVLSNNFINKYNSLFIIQLLKIQLKKFSWGGNGATLGRLENTKILLPVNNTNLPDYKFMGNYIKEVMIRKRKEYIIYAENRLKTLSKGVKHQQKQRVDNIKWKDVKIIDILNNSINARAYHSNLLTEIKYKGIPYVTRTNLSNGLQCIVENKQNFKKNPSNTIVFGAENAKYFYQPFNYITGNKMYYYNTSKLSQEVNLFTTCCLNLSLKKCSFGFGMGLTGTRSNSRKFILPINSEGQPDYKFMENYISNIIYKKYNEYLTYAKSKIC